MAKKLNSALKRQQDHKHQTGDGHGASSNSFVPETRSAIQKKIKESRRKHYNQESSTMFQHLMVFFLGVLVAVASGGYFWYTKLLKDIVITPLNSPKVIDTNATLPFVEASRFWGSYRPGVYFGMKARSQDSPNFGLMWMTQSSQFPPDIRHWCSQGDGLEKYGWLAHDGINFGKHEAVDRQFIVKSDFVKQPGGNHGGEWTSKIKILPKAGQQDIVVSLFLYMALDNNKGQLIGDVVKDKLVAIRGSVDDLGLFRLSFESGDEFSHSVLMQNYLITRVPENVGDLKSVVYDNFDLAKVKNSPNHYLVLRGSRMPEGVDVESANFVVSQLTVNLPFELEVIYESGSLAPRNFELSGKNFDAKLEEFENKFNEKFEDIFQLKKQKFPSAQIDFAKSVFSNLVGGIGYFHGSSLVKSKQTLEPVSYWDAALYTAVPSRSFFPRGFLWDEGFHNLLICRWNADVSMDIIGHWLDLMNIEGWIPREQILGSEARARVPENFVVQDNENANPPTLFLTLETLLSDKTFSRKNSEFLQRIYPRLAAWYNWYNRTQKSSHYYSAYYWRGRNASTLRELNPKTLTSGLDDYPRASHPTDQERHLDLRCWMMYMSGILTKISKHLGYDQWKEYDRMQKLLSDNKLLNELHWSEAKGRYSDYGLHTDKVELKRPPRSVSKNLKPDQRPPNEHNLPPPEKVRVTLSEPKLKFVDSELGYVNLFPFLLKSLEPNSPQLGKILSDLPDTDLLWTIYGLRSLARNSPHYRKHNTEHDPPYWRGAIWININYLAVAALKHYSLAEGPFSSVATDLYENLRNNLIKNMYEQYLKTGYIWEQYDDITGIGKGSHPFTGWSSLVVLIMAEQY